MKEILKNILYNIYFRLKYYKIKRNHKQEDRIILIFDKNKNYCGIADIIKAIVGIYYIAKQNHLDFKIYCHYPLILSDYLGEGYHKWIIKKEDINYSIWQTKIISYSGLEEQPPLKKGYEYHVYNFLGKNILQNINVENWKSEWHNLFSELFKPRQLILDRLTESGIIPNTYSAVHIRLLNTLEISEPLSVNISKPLDEENKNRLLNIIFEEIENINRINKVIVFSDSELFNYYSKERGYMTIDGKIGHISYCKCEETTFKTFMDWFAISMAKSIYSIRGAVLYNSAFPFYASLIGNKEYFEINISEKYERKN